MSIRRVEWYKAWIKKALDLVCMWCVFVCSREQLSVCVCVGVGGVGKLSSVCAVYLFLLSLCGVINVSVAPRK